LASWVTLFICLASFSGSPPAHAKVTASPAPASADRKLHKSGLLHTVSVEIGTSGTGTRLIHRIQRPDGTVELKTIPGTEGTEIEADPSLSISPVNGHLTLAWSRKDTSDFEICLSIFDGAVWGPVQTLTVNSWDDKKPLVVTGPAGYSHLMWEAYPPSLVAPVYFQAVLDETGTALLLPTESFLTPEPPLAGSLSPPPSLSDSAILFAFVPLTKSGPPSVILYGGTDEPIPLSHRVDFVLPAGSPSISAARVDRVGPRVVLFARQSTALLYSIESASGWSPLLSLRLDTISEEKAELLIRDMAAHAPPP